MGFFSKKTDKKEEKGNNTNAPIKMVVLSCESRTNSQMVVKCSVEVGRVNVGDELIYKPQFGDEVKVLVKTIEAMMANLKFAYENTDATFTLEGNFELLSPTIDDEIIR